MIYALGNWKNLSENVLRLKTNITMNKGFLSAMVSILECLPFVVKTFFES